MFKDPYQGPNKEIIECIKGIMRSEDYQGISEQNVLHSVGKLGMTGRS